MQGNSALFLIAFCGIVLGVFIAFANRTRPNGIAHNFGLIIMVNGSIMMGGLVLFGILSMLISVVRGH